MSFQPGVARQGGVGLVIAALLLVFSGVFAGAAAAGPDKQPDTTLDDHPSGKDRTEEPGNSGTQGKAASDPDDTANRGPDKPEQAGGFDDDKDGNNGCGNDDDFDDDNNGWCGKPESKDNSQEETPCDADKNMAGIQKCEESKSKRKSKVCDADKKMAGIQKCEKDDVLADRDEKPCDKDDNMANGIQECGPEDVVLGDFEAKPLPDAPAVLGTRFARGLTRPAGLRPTIAPRVVRGGRVAGGVLPFTGSEPLGLLLIGLGILASGAVTMVATRK